MKRILTIAFTLLLISPLAPQNIVQYQNLELYDVFPLAKWNQYNYNYQFSDTTYYVGAFEYAQNDSGTIEFLITDSTLVGNNIEWLVEQRKHLVRHYVTPISDSIFAINSIDSFKILEDRYSGKLIEQSNFYWVTKIWQFPFTDDFQVYRYVSVPSLIMSYSDGLTGGFDSLWFNNTKGLYKRRRKFTYLGNSQNYTEMIANLVGSIVGLSDRPYQKIDEFILTQNYPNPFNPSTKIKYAIPASLNPSEGGTLVILKVYDLLGREVATVMNEEKLAGYYEIEFNGNNLPSGVYFYRLKAGGFVETKKMILLR